jgi:hypothetical protein
LSKNINSYLEQHSLQTEIAILQKKILAFKQCCAKLYIPALMGSEDDFIEAPMPLHLSITYGDKIIPKGTKLIIQTVSGNYNDIRIIGFYDNPKPFDFIAFMKKYLISNESILPDDYDRFIYDEIKE